MSDRPHTGGSYIRDPKTGELKPAGAKDQKPAKGKGGK